MTLTAAILALAANTSNGAVALIAVLPGITFWGLDAYYLRLEKLYRALYDDVRTKNSEEDALSMEVRKYESSVIEGARYVARAVVAQQPGPVFHWDLSHASMVHCLLDHLDE